MSLAEGIRILLRHSQRRRPLRFNPGRSDWRTVPRAEAQALIRRVDELELAILEHRAKIALAGSIGYGSEFSRRQLEVLAAKQAADRQLWRLVP